MFDHQKAYRALQKKEAVFHAYLESHQRQIQVQREQLEEFDRHDYDSLQQLLARGGVSWPGAIPTAELDRANRLSIPFTHSWRDHQQARSWALDKLMDRPVIAVDGSQISPTLELATPVGAVQIGWFINHHSEKGTYVKDLDFEVFLPPDLLGDDDGDQELDHANRRINQERFERECIKLCDLMIAYENVADDQKPLCFFDGSFIISFAGQLRRELATPYLMSIQKVLNASKRFRVPLVGFVDNPHSRDVARLMEFTLSHGSERRESRVGGLDAEILHARLPQHEWGARSPLFICARADALSREDERTGDGRAAFYKSVCFTYLRLTQDRPPARIELPLWLINEGRADEIIDLVRAECIVGLGYPYAIETADALAVISHRDRERFYTLVQQSYPEINLTQARKATSKLARR